MAKKGELMHCSFCGKSQKAVQRLVAGPGVYICDECVALCNGILESHPPKSNEPERLQELEKRGTEELLAFLRPVAKVTMDIDRHLKATVDILRDRGLSWMKIGEALGTSRQAAWERFARDE